MVLRALLHDRRDGCLTVARGGTTRRLYLRGGMIIYGSSSERQERLGEILVAQGKISKADLEVSLDECTSGNRVLGITLVVNGRITAGDLAQAVTAQVVTVLDRLQKWQKGDYEFKEGHEPVAGTVLLCIPVALYLGADSENRPGEKKRTKRTSRRKGTPAEPPPSGSDAEADQPQPSEVDGDEDQVLEIRVDATEEEPLSAEAARETEIVGEISSMIQALRGRLGQDPFTLLGVPPEADHSAVQAAYHGIAKVLHPDRLPRGCTPELLHEADEIYREVTAASQAAEEHLRRKTDAPQGAAPSAAPTVQRARPVPSEDDQSRRFFMQGREWISKRNYWQAADALRQAVRLKPDDATYRQYLGIALLQTKRMHEAEEHLMEASRLEPNNPVHFVNLGRVYRGGRLFKKAREAFERALRIDPRNDHAREELRDLPEEQPPGRKAESGGLLKKLFGKG